MICVKRNLPKSEVVVATTTKKKKKKDLDVLEKREKKRFNNTTFKIRLRSSRKSIISS